MPGDTFDIKTSISIHAPRRGSDCNVIRLFCAFRLFQSTLPAGGATRPHPRSGCGLRISIHAPRRGSDREIYAQGTAADDISIHAPRRGSDSNICPILRINVISIHAPRRGSDSDNSASWLPLLRISIHAPRRGSD